MICLSFYKVTLAAGLEIDRSGQEQREEASSVILHAWAGDDGGLEQMVSTEVVRVAGFQIHFEEIAGRCLKKAIEELRVTLKFGQSNQSCPLLKGEVCRKNGFRQTKCSR